MLITGPLANEIAQIWSCDRCIEITISVHQVKSVMLIHMHVCTIKLH